MKTHIIKNPRITEKGASVAEQNAYTFDVIGQANKKEIAKAIFAIYKVHPVRVNVSVIPKKSVRYRGRSYVRDGGKKAYVYLKKGDKIEFV